MVIWKVEISAVAAISVENQKWIGIMIGILLLILMIGAVCVALVRRKLLNSSNTTTTGYTLEGLQKMHTGGLISDEEYKQMKDQIIQDLGSV